MEIQNEKTREVYRLLLQNQKHLLLDRVTRLLKKGALVRDVEAARLLALLQPEFELLCEVQRVKDVATN